MDPNANLEEARRIADRLLNQDAEDGSDVEDGRRLAELVQALDEWIMKGGFLPRDWQKGR
jgi:hypothetical protein